MFISFKVYVGTEWISCSVLPVVLFEELRSQILNAEMCRFLPSVKMNTNDIALLVRCNVCPATTNVAWGSFSMITKQYLQSCIRHVQIALLGASVSLNEIIFGKQLSEV